MVLVLVLLHLFPSGGGALGHHCERTLALHLNDGAANPFLATAPELAVCPNSNELVIFEGCRRPMSEWKEKFRLNEVGRGDFLAGASLLAWRSPRYTQLSVVATIP